ncbi:MAG: hypothetical protein ACXW0T_12450, partial [Methylobacter sp.]
PTEILGIPTDNYLRDVLTETDLKNLENIGIYGTMRLNTINLKDGDIPHIVKNLNVHYQRMITLDNNNAERRNP